MRSSAQAPVGEDVELAGPRQRLRAVWLGRMAFERALSLQLAARDELAAGRGEPTLFLVEHPPTITIGRRGRRADLLWPEAQLQARGIEVCETPRGGELTLHAPGQLVAYPVLDIGRRIREHIVRLGEVTRALVGELGVVGAEFRMEHPGVWVGGWKLASIGIHVSRGITVQGMALNIEVDRQLLGALVSCGLRDPVVTSVAQLGGRVVAPEVAGRRWAELFARDIEAPLSWG